MCGIAGIVGLAANEALLNKMLVRIAHRGESAYRHENRIFNNIAIGMNRLAIVDEPNGKQPFTNNAGVFCIFNGEIYNYLTLRAELEQKGVLFHSHSDTEVLLHLYRKDGAAMLPKLRGMFAFAIWDEQEQNLFLARDHFGIKPLYIANNGKTIRFASQVKAL